MVLRKKFRVGKHLCPVSTFSPMCLFEGAVQKARPRGAQTTAGQSHCPNPSATFFFWQPAFWDLLNCFFACIHRATSWRLSAMAVPLQLGWLWSTIPDVCTNWNRLFATVVILRPARDWCWQVGERRKTGNERNHLLPLKRTNSKVLGPGVNSTWLLQNEGIGIFQRKVYLKEFSKILVLMSWKNTKFQTNFLGCWICP